MVQKPSAEGSLTSAVEEGSRPGAPCNRGAVLYYRRARSRVAVHNKKGGSDASRISGSTHACGTRGRPPRHRGSRRGVARVRAERERRLPARPQPAARERQDPHDGCARQRRLERADRRQPLRGGRGQDAARPVHPTDRPEGTHRRSGPDRQSQPRRSAGTPARTRHTTRERTVDHRRACDARRKSEDSAGGRVDHFDRRVRHQPIHARARPRALPDVARARHRHAEATRCSSSSRSRARR